MNIVDAIILVALLIALRRGMRFGLLSLVFSAAGFLVGIYAGSLLASVSGGAIADPTGKMLASITLCLVSGFLLASIGEAIANAISPHVYKWKLGGLNQVLGAAFEAGFVLVIVWLFASALANIQTSNIGRQVRSSFIVGTLNKALPPEPGVLSRLEQVLQANGFPRVFIGNEPFHRLAPNNSTISDDVIRTAQKSVVKIEGDGCGGVIEGSGLAVQSGVVVTNAHVVAGITNPYIIADGREYRATPVYFDSSKDLAILRASGLPTPSLPLTSNTLADNSPIAILGFPGGGPLTISGGSVIDHLTAVGRDIYDHGVVARDIYEVQADVEPGNSGGPMIDDQGHVAGVVFAKSVSNGNVGYVLLANQLAGTIEQYQSSQAPVATGKCAAD